MVERTLISFPSQLQLIGRLQHLLYLSSSMVFISGEKGSGKSTLIEQLSNQLSDTTQQAFIYLAEPVSVKQIRLQIISQLFDQPLFDADDTLFNSLMQLKNDQNANIARVVVIDNAELLPKELLHELANVIKHKSLICDNEINFVLLSDELHNNQMLKQVKQAKDNQAITALAFKLSPLEIGEANKLLAHCLTQVGYSPKIQHQDAIAKQLVNCQGIPEKILLLATKVSSGKLKDEQQSWFKARFPAILLMLVLLSVLAGLSIYLYPKFIKPQAELTAIVQDDAILLDEIHSSDVVTGKQNIGKENEALAGQWSNEKKLIDDNKLKVGVADSEERTVIDGSQLLELEKSSQAIAFADDEDLSHDPELSVLAPAIEQIDITAEGANIELIAEEAEPDASGLTVTKATTAQQIANSTQFPPSQEEAQREATTHKPFISSDILLAVDPDFYTLQLAAMSSEKSLQEFIVTHQLVGKNFSIYQTVRSGGNWYVVIYGQFENRSAALREAQELSNSPTKLESWVKKYALVHQDLQLNEQ